MKRFLGAVMLTVFVTALGTSVRAEDKQDPKAIVDKAIKALGGEEKLSKLKAATWKGKGKINFGGMESEFNNQVTMQGLDHVRSQFQGNFGGQQIEGVTVLAGDKGWRKFGDMGMELDKDGVANEKRSVYLQIIPVTLVPLKGQGFKLGAVEAAKVGDRPAVGIKIVGPDGKDFTLYFDKDSGLPVKQVARVAGFMGDEFTQETTYADYKDFDGIKRATKVESKRDGEKFIEQQITEFKVLDKVDPKTFAEPQ